jgi:hypothetical protein
LGLPAALRRSKKALSTGLCRRATMAPMNRALRTLTHPAAADEALAAPLARLTREGGKADKRGDLLAVEGSKLRQLSNERARDYRPDTGQ